MSKKPEKWMQDAVKRPGAFTKKAKEHHMGVQEYAHEVLKSGSHASKLTKDQARFAINANKISKRHKGN